MKNIKKVLASLLVSLFLVMSMSAPHLAHAQTADLWWKPNYKAFADKVSGSPPTEIFGERYTYAQVSWIVNSLVSVLGGPIAECAAKGGDIGTCIRQNLGAMGPILSTLALADTLQTSKPASGIDYVAQKLQKLNIIDTAYAQAAIPGGYGFSKALLPIQQLWVATRNAAFALTTFAIIILAFMIMFRAKISPQVVISAQSALPKVAIGLIFITFSYAIAGLMVDLAFVIQGVIAAIVSASGVIGANPATQVVMGPIQIFNQVQDGMGSLLAYGIAFVFESFEQGGIIGKAINTGANWQGVSRLIFPAFDAIIALIVLIILLIVSIRILWLLIMTYGKVIFLVLGGPFFALMAIAGQGSGIGGWIKKLASELSVFVAIGILIMFVHIIFYSFGNGMGVLSMMAQINPFIKINVNPFGVVIPTGQALADLKGSGLMPSGFSFGDNSPAIGFFVSLAIAISIPKLASALRDAIATGRGSFGFGIGGASPVEQLGYTGAKAKFATPFAEEEAKARSGGRAVRTPYRAGKAILDNLGGFMK